MTKLSQEDFEDYMYMKTGEIQSASSRMSSIEKSFSELQESVGEMVKRQHIIAAALVTLANKLEPGSIDMDQPTARDEMPITMEELADMEEDHEL